MYRCNLTLVVLCLCGGHEKYGGRILHGYIASLLSSYFLFFLLLIPLSVFIYVVCLSVYVFCSMYVCISYVYCMSLYVCAFTFSILYILCCVVHVWPTWEVWWQFPSFHVISILALCFIHSCGFLNLCLLCLCLDVLFVCIFVYVYVSSYMLYVFLCVCMSVYVHACVHVRIYVGMCVYVYMYVLSFRIVLFHVWQTCEGLWLDILGRLILPYMSWFYFILSNILYLFLGVTFL